MKRKAIVSTVLLALVVAFICVCQFGQPPVCQIGHDEYELLSIQEWHFGPLIHHGGPEAQRLHIYDYGPIRRMTWI